MATAIVPEPLEKQSTDLVSQANQVQPITTAEHYESAVNIGKALRSMKKGVEDFFNPIKSKAYASWKEICATENKLLNPLKVAQDGLDRKIGSYLQAQEQERQRREQEAREAALKAEQDRLLAEASHLSQTGQQEEAEQVLEQAVKVEAPPVVMPSSVPKIAGASQRTGWKFEVTDLQALVKAVAEGKVPIGAIKADEVFLGQMARAMKANMKWPGVRVYSEQSVAMRG